MGYNHEFSTFIVYGLPIAFFKELFISNFKLTEKLQNSRNNLIIHLTSSHWFLELPPLVFIFVLCTDEFFSELFENRLHA